jgi:hypothetical protein
LWTWQLLVGSRFWKSAQDLREVRHDVALSSGDQAFCSSPGSKTYRAGDKRKYGGANLHASPEDVCSEERSGAEDGSQGGQGVRAESGLHGRPSLFFLHTPH